MSSKNRPILPPAQGNGATSPSYDEARADYASRRTVDFQSSGVIQTEELQLTPPGRHAELTEGDAEDFVRAIMPNADPEDFRRAVELMNRAASRSATEARNSWQIAGDAGILEVVDQACRVCHGHFGDLLDLSSKRERPRRGDVSICQRCADVTIFDVDKRRRLARRAPSALESEKIRSSPQVSAAQIAIRVRAALAAHPAGKL